jgi:NAD(P)H-dependent FMN reductase
MHILAVSGSLRAASKNATVLEAARLLAPPGMEIEPDHSIAALPHYNPDLDALDGAGMPEAAARWRARVGAADGVLISSPEYAHGVPGVLKNSLDWLVSSTEFPGKPVALLTASALSVHAPAQLRETLTTMNARFIDGASAVVPVSGSMRDASAVAADAELSGLIRRALDAFALALASGAR